MHQPGQNLLRTVVKIVLALCMLPVFAAGAMAQEAEAIAVPDPAFSAIHGSGSCGPNCGLGPASPYPVTGIDCVNGCGRGCGETGWDGPRTAYFQAYAQGEYVGLARTPHVDEYRLRVDDLLELVYRLTRDELSHPYQFNVGDEVRVESLTDPDLNRTLVIQPDGTITLRLLGQVRATRRTVTELQRAITKQYGRYYRDPEITVTPIKVNTKLEDLRATVDSRFGQGGQGRPATVTPDGTIALPALGSVYAQGLTVDELGREINERYAAEIPGIEVTPVLVERAPRFVYVLGEVAIPGRYVLEGPTTAMQAIALAGGWNVGAGLNQMVIFRRGEDWRLMATRIRLRGALFARRPCPADEIWLSDSDIVLVPKSGILATDDAIELVFTRGIYGVFPFSTALNLTELGGF